MKRYATLGHRNGRLFVVWSSALATWAAAASAQPSQFALRFYGTGVGPPGQQDRVRIQIDDNAAGPDASAPCDLGAGSFTIELWLRGTLADNNSSNAGGDVETFDDAWIYGNVIVDRDIWGGGAAGERKWGVSIAGGFIRFGTSAGDALGDLKNTIEGSINVLDGNWHHVAVVRDAITGRKHIFVDGRLDFSSSPGVSNNDISYPNNGAPGQNSPWGPYIVLAAEKHDAGSSFPSFNGYMDEVRFWTVARTQREIFDTYDRVIPNNTPGLVGYYRFEEGSGTSVVDSSAAGSPTGVLIAGVPGNGEWVSFASHPLNVPPISNSALPAGFFLSQLVAGLNEATVAEFLPDGRLLIGERGGRIRIFADGSLVEPPAISLPTDTAGGERGLVGLARDPNFAANGYIYAYWTTNEPRNRVSRLTLVGNTINPASEFVVWQNVNLAMDYHHGGSIAFGPDGNLFIATGDQFEPSRAQPLNFEDGKILRVRPDGTVPPSNPFVATPGARPTIWLTGERNPFRFHWDFPTGRLYIGNVGGNSSDSWEEINVGSVAQNHGWPNQEGPQCFVSDCSAYTFPWYAYQHNDARYFVGVPQASITVGPVYRATGGASLFPPEYRGQLYVGDYANRWIRRLVLDAAGNVIGDPLFLRPPNANTIVDLDVAPDGSLYFLTVGLDNSGNPDPAGSGLFRIGYSGVGNLTPVASASANPTQGLPPLSVQFSSAGSYDPDNGPSPLSYAWVFGDGNTSSQPNPLHTYATRGQYTARLTVLDGAAAAQSPPILITVGDPPTASIAEPPPGTTYRAGDTILFSGSASDTEDGPLPASALSWRVVLRHLDHTHPFLGPLQGVSGGSFVVPAAGHGPEDTSYEIELTATDSDGLTHAAVRTINPVISTLIFSADPPGIPLFLDGEAINTPRTYRSLEGFQHVVEAQSSFVLGGTTYVFACWSDGGPRVHGVTAPPVGGSYTAYYSRGSSSQNTLTVSVSAGDRNADYNPVFGTAFGNGFDPNQLCFGRDDGGVYESAAAFSPAVPRGAIIVSARLRVTATNDNSGSPIAVIRAYDVGNLPPFVVGPASLTSFQPLTTAGVNWNPPPFTAGQTYDSPELAALIQNVVNRMDWSAGNFLGVVLDGGGSALNTWRCYRNLQGGPPPQLVVTYQVPGAPVGDVNNDGALNADDIELFVRVLLGLEARCDRVLRSDLTGDGRADGRDVRPFVAALLGV